MYHTVREAELEAENARLRRELDMYKFRDSARPQYLYTDPIDETREFEGPLPLDMRLAVSWSIKDDKAKRAYSVMGKAWMPDQSRLDHGYYVTKESLQTAIDRKTLLGCLHEQVIKALSKQHPLSSEGD